MSLRDIALSEYGRASSRPSPVNRMMAEFAGSSGQRRRPDQASDFRDGIDINLGVGYVNERTIPSERIVEALRTVLGDPRKHRLPFNYGGPKGSPNLIASLRRYLLDETAQGLTPEVLGGCEVIVGPSGATSILEGLGQVLKPGIVVTTDPMYYIFCEFLERRGFELATVPEDEDGMRTDLLERKLSALGGGKDEISFFYVVTIGNPSCTILSNARRRRLVEIATGLSDELGRKVPVFLDRAYEDLVHDPSVGPLLSSIPGDRAGLVHEIGTLSKVLAPALRIGYMIGPPSAFMDSMVQKTSDTGFSAPVVTQEIASYMLDHHVAEQIESVKRGYRDKALKVARWIDEKLGEFLVERRGGRAGFYFYLTFDGIDTADGGPFFRFLSRTTGEPEIDGAPGPKKPRVVYLPGSYCVHPRGDTVEKGRRQLRLSYAFEELDRIRDALAMMADAARYARKLSSRAAGTDGAVAPDATPEVR